MDPSSGTVPGDGHTNDPIGLLTSPHADGTDQASVALAVGHLAEGRRHNRDVEWENFAPVAYWEHNYRHLREDDRAIIRTVAAFFAEHFAGSGSGRPALQPGAPGLQGIDVGSGANLYPALSMLPWCNAIHLTDHSPANVAWLVENTGDPGANSGDPWAWAPFWDQFVAAGKSAYESVGDPRGQLARATAANIRQASVFTLESAWYDIGTMFFVAETITSYENEFSAATAKFIHSLRPGSPFAAAFMDSSTGSLVSDKSFPAVKEVTEEVVRTVLVDDLGATARVSKIQVSASDPLRDGYEGMIVAVGTTHPGRT